MIEAMSNPALKRLIPVDEDGAKAFAEFVFWCEKNAGVRSENKIAFALLWSCPLSPTTYKNGAESYLQAYNWERNEETIRKAGLSASTIRRELQKKGVMAQASSVYAEDSYDADDVKRLLRRDYDTAVLNGETKLAKDLLKLMGDATGLFKGEKEEVIEEGVDVAKKAMQERFKKGGVKLNLRDSNG